MAAAASRLPTLPVGGSGSAGVTDNAMKSSIPAILLLGVIGGIETAAPNISSSALVSVSRDLHMSTAELALAASAQTILIAATVITTGMLADRLGRRLVLSIGLLVGAAGSAVCAFAPAPPCMWPDRRSSVSGWGRLRIGVRLSAGGRPAGAAGAVPRLVQRNDRVHHRQSHVPRQHSHRLQLAPRTRVNRCRLDRRCADRAVAASEAAAGSRCGARPPRPGAARLRRRRLPRRGQPARSQPDRAQLTGAAARRCAAADRLRHPRGQIRDALLPHPAVRLALARGGDSGLLRLLLRHRRRVPADDEPLAVRHSDPDARTGALATAADRDRGGQPDPGRPPPRPRSLVRHCPPGRDAGDGCGAGAVGAGEPGDLVHSVPARHRPGGRPASLGP